MSKYRCHGLIASNSCSTGQPAIPDIGHVQSPVSAHTDLNCCSTLVYT